MAETKPQTEREAVIQHFVDNELGFEDPSHDTVDLVMYLAQHKTTIFNDQFAYVDKIVKAGVQSSIGKQLLEDIRKAVKTVL